MPTGGAIVISVPGRLGRFHHLLVLASPILKPYFDLQQRGAEDRLELHHDIIPVCMCIYKSITQSAAEIYLGYRYDRIFL